MSANAAGDTARLVEAARDPAAPLQEQHLAFAQLVEQSQHLVFGLAFALLRDADDARDAVQDAFLSAFRSIDRFAGGAKLSTWLHQIVINASLMKLRTRRRHPEEPIEPLLPLFAEDGHHAVSSAGWGEGADDVIARGRRARFARLPPVPEGLRRRCGQVPAAGPTGQRRRQPPESAQQPVPPGGEPEPARRPHDVRGGGHRGRLR